MIALLVNPAAGGGRAAPRADAMERALAAGATVRRYTTTGRGDEARQVTRALDDGAQGLVVVGGDGAVHHAVSALHSASRHSPSRHSASHAGSTAPPLAVCAAGTGNDFVKSLGTPSHDVAALAALVHRGQTRRIDLGMMGGVPFCNAAGLGFDVDVLTRMQRPSIWRGTAAYVVTALTALRGFRGLDLQIDDAPRQRHLMVVFANGHVFGGAFRIAPGARLDNGQLHAVAIGEVARWQRPAVLGLAVLGRHLQHPAVTSRQRSAFVLRGDDRTPLRFEADGELYDAPSGELAVSVLPAALTVYG
jgi:diacylglycerol kinase (ATP)